MYHLSCNLFDFGNFTERNKLKTRLNLKEKDYQVAFDSLQYLEHEIYSITKDGPPNDLGLKCSFIFDCYYYLF